MKARSHIALFSKDTKAHAQTKALHKNAIFSPHLCLFVTFEWLETTFALLATIVEKVSEQSYQSFMAKNIFQPLKMNHTRIYNTRCSLKDTIPNYAYGFVYNDSLKTALQKIYLGVTKI